MKNKSLISTREKLRNYFSCMPVIHHYNDLSSVPKFRIQLNQLLNMKWKKVVLSQVDVQHYPTTESSKGNITLCDYVIQNAPNTTLHPLDKSNRRKGFDRLCEQYVYSSLSSGLELSENSNVWLSSSPESSLDVNKSCNNEAKSKRQSEHCARVPGKL